ncbi:glycosyltransferase family 4 protein [Porifericola rhodea]|uniref:glycosyltransferase family 4 protein n=1 Tax=Porifericola rhodea TaxID=930972 RepID=UPI0026657339|nr:glycosyltransferase family 4 protein [Porifericola rhodea]WKN33474.1 glycosyltransferase family 4 protein [Porifericola rhodea]
MHRTLAKNVIVLEDSHKVSFGGGQKGTLEVMEALSSSYHIYLFDSTKQSGFYQKAIQRKYKVYQLYSFGKIVGGKKASFSIGILEVLLYPIFTFLNILKLVFFLKKRKLTRHNTVVYTSAKKMLAPTLFIHKIFKIKYVYHARNYYDRNSFYFKVLTFLLSKATLVISVSHTVLQNLGHPRSIVIYNPIKLNTPLPSPRQIDPTKVIVAAFASLIPWKGLEYFMKSFSFLRNKNNVQYHIYGKGQEQKYLSKLTNDQVLLKGFTDKTEEIMEGQVNIICVPSISEEAFGRVSIEGFKFGIPAISTNIGGQKELIKDNFNGFHVPIMDPKAIAEKIDYLIENPTIYTELSQNALAYVKEFDYTSFSKRIKTQFDNIFSNQIS